LLSFLSYPLSRFAAVSRHRQRDTHLSVSIDRSLSATHLKATAGQTDWGTGGCLRKPSQGFCT